MKKSTIGVIITAGVLIVGGICLCIGGVAAAGGMEAAREALRGSGVELSRVYTIEKDEDGWDLDFERNSHDTAHPVEEAQNTEANQAMYDVALVKNLDLEIGHAKVEFVVDSSITEIGVVTKDKFEIYDRNGILYVKSPNALEEHTVRLEIPENTTFTNVEIKGNSCEIIIPYIEAKEFDIEAAAGLVKIEKLNADKAEFEIGAGEIMINAGNVKECDVNVGMGKFAYHGTVTRHGDVECGMGTAELYLDAKEEDYNYEIECEAGNVTIGQNSYEGVHVEKMINNSANAMIEIDCSVGNVTIGF